MAPKNACSLILTDHISKIFQDGKANNHGGLTEKHGVKGEFFFAEVCRTPKSAL
jgi:hypothetical protein